MAFNPPSREPDRLSAGTTWSWRRDDLAQDYPANSGWNFAYAFANAGGTFALSSQGGSPAITADGASFVVLVPVATTNGIAAGVYTWALRALDGSGNSYEVDRGRLAVLPSLTSGDPRTHARKVLDLIESAIEGRASRTELEYEISVNGSMRRLSSFPHSELLLLRGYYQSEVQAEEEADRVAQGRGGRRRVFSRFTRAYGFMPLGNFWPPFR